MYSACGALGAWLRHDTRRILGNRSKRKAVCRHAVALLLYGLQYRSSSSIAIFRIHSTTVRQSNSSEVNNYQFDTTRYARAKTYVAVTIRLLGFL